MEEQRSKVTKPDWLIAQEKGLPYTWTKRVAPRKPTDPGIETGYSARRAGLEPPIKRGTGPVDERSKDQWDQQASTNLLENG